MKTSPVGLALIKSYESLSLVPYHDSAGYPTTGWGHLLSREKWADLSQWTPITEHTAGIVLQDDLADAEHAVNTYVKVELRQPQFDALVSFTFNLGAGDFRSSTLLRRINRGKHLQVPTQLYRWIKAGGKPSLGLARRRAAEVVLYLS